MEDCFEADVGNNGKEVFTFKVRNFAYEGHYEKPTKIMSQHWDEKTHKWSEMVIEILPGVELYKRMVDSITICPCLSSPPKGGKKTRLKSRKNSSKKNSSYNPPSLNYDIGFLSLCSSYITSNRKTSNIYTLEINYIYLQNYTTFRLCIRMSIIQQQ